MRKILAVVTGFLCLAAQAGHSQSFEQQVRRISRELSGAALRTRQALDSRADARGIVPAGYVGEDNPPAVPVEWVAIRGGKFLMGTDNGHSHGDAIPIHEVVVRTFEMSRTPVTVEQYAECVNKGRCTRPGTGDRGYCNWGKRGRGRHPVNCVDWDQANQYARFKGARLPSESEWEYAATSEGRNQKYPWGDEDASCARAVMRGDGDIGCGGGGTLPVCSKPAGNTAQGLCDMAGNVYQWVQDRYQSSYAGAPGDGLAFEAAGASRVMRGGSFFDEGTGSLRADSRGYAVPDYRFGGIGFRLALSGR